MATGSHAGLTLRLDRGDTRYGEINACCFCRDIGCNRQGPVRIEGRFCAGFETYRRSDIGPVPRLHEAIAQKYEALDEVALKEITRLFDAADM